MNLLPGYEEKIAALPPYQESPTPRRTPKNRNYYRETLRYVQTAAEAESVAQLAAELDLSWVGLDTEFKYDAAAVPIEGKKHPWYDPRSTHPLLMSFAFMEKGEHLYPVVVDVRNPDVLPALKKILSLPVRIVGHFLKAELFCMWKLGLVEPLSIWDTWVAEFASDLGRNNFKYRTSGPVGDEEQAKAKADLDDHTASAYSLIGVCNRHDIPYRFAADKERLQSAFLTHVDNAPFSQEQLEYAALDAEAAAELYLAQINAATVSGLLSHFELVEMPWVTTNARIEWHGVRCDPAKCKVVTDAAARHSATVEMELQKFGIENSNSHPQLQSFFERTGLLELFRRDGKYSFDRKQLKAFHARHPAIKFLYIARLIKDMEKSGVFDSRLVGRDGRLHPSCKQLGTDTGRGTTSNPNILGLSRAQRPLIVPDEGCGIGEVDLSQIEVGVAAAIYGDHTLIDMWNSGDVYTAMAQHFYSGELSAADRSLTGKLFKKRFGNMRDQMKICTLGIIFGMTAHGIANQLNCSEPKARELQCRFMEMFPALNQALQDAPHYGAQHGFVSTVSGLRRHRAKDGQLSNWEQNWMKNHPVQGSAAVVFKRAGNRLDRLYPQYGAKLIVAFHDAYVFEAPREHLQAVAELTAQEMTRAVQEFFPMLKPNVDINISAPECWNKDGNADSWREWVDDPLAYFEKDVGLSGT